VTDLLVINNVSKGYWRGPRKLRVLSGVSLQVGVGEIAATVGARDEGKTTLLKLAAGMELPDDGQVLFNGQDLSSLSRSVRERLLGDEIAWISRERPGIEWRTACQLVALPLRLGRGRRNALRQALVALEFVGAEKCADQTWDELSNWERMLVGLARAYACRPRLALIDDLLDGFGILRIREANTILRAIVDELGCGMLMSASGIEATLEADQVWSFGNGQLKPMGDQPAAADVIDFPRNSSLGIDSRRTGG
jgi:putative ABC transport system ATP-binding protein